MIGLGGDARRGKFGGELLRPVSRSRVDDSRPRGTVLHQLQHPLGAAALALGGERKLESLTALQALAIGLWQCTALIPGISRSGAAMVGGLVAGLQHAEAAHFSFLIATPIILGAAVLEVPKMLALPGHGISLLALVSGVVAGVTAYLSIAFLMRYFRRHDFDDALVPFSIYCWVAGAAAAFMLVI